MSASSFDAGEVQRQAQVLREAAAILDARAHDALLASRETASPAVCGKEQNRARSLWLAARVLEHETHDGRAGG